MTATLDGVTTTYTLHYGVELSNTGNSGTDEVIKLSDPLIDAIGKLFADKTICPNVTSIPVGSPKILPGKVGHPKHSEGVSRKRMDAPVIDELRPNDCTGAIINETMNNIGPGQQFQGMILRQDGEGFRELGGADAPNGQQLEALVLEWNARANVDPRFAAYVGQS